MAIEIVEWTTGSGTGRHLGGHGVTPGRNWGPPLADRRTRATLHPEPPADPDRRRSAHSYSGRCTWPALAQGRWPWTRKARGRCGCASLVLEAPARTVILRRPPLEDLLGRQAYTAERDVTVRPGYGGSNGPKPRPARLPRARRLRPRWELGCWRNPAGPPGAQASGWHVEVQGRPTTNGAELIAWVHEAIDQRLPVSVAETRCVHPLLLRPSATPLGPGRRPRHESRCTSSNPRLRHATRVLSGTPRWWPGVGGAGTIAGFGLLSYRLALQGHRPRFGAPAQGTRDEAGRRRKDRVCGFVVTVFRSNYRPKKRPGGAGVAAKKAGGQVMPHRGCRELRGRFFSPTEWRKLARLREAGLGIVFVAGGLTASARVSQTRGFIRAPGTQASPGYGGIIQLYSRHASAGTRMTAGRGFD